MVLLTKEEFIARSRDEFSKALGKKVSHVYEKKRCTFTFEDELENKVTMKLYEFWPVVGGSLDTDLYSVKISVRVNGIHPSLYEMHKKDGIEFGVSEEMYEPYSDIIRSLVKHFC